MKILTDRFLALLNLRSFVVVVAAWACIGLPQPAWLTSMTAAVDGALFRIAMDFSALPSSQSHITVVHVSPVEYESWLADIPGAQRLESLIALALTTKSSAEDTEAGDTTTPKNDASENLQRSGSSSNSMVGLVLEKPLSMIQTQAESLLTDIQQGRRTHDHLYNEVSAVLSRRERLMDQLRGPNVVLGVEGALYGGGESVRITQGTPWAAQIPAWMQKRLWQPAARPTELSGANPVFEYAPIWPQDSLARSLITQVGTNTLPGFELLFLQAAARLNSTGSTFNSTSPAFNSTGSMPTDNTGRLSAELGVSPKPIQWHRASGFQVGANHYRASVFGETIPLYGAHSNLRSALRQLSLDAALASDNLSGWVLVGRDGSSTLELLAQTIAAMTDGAEIIEPIWWSPLQKVLLILLALFLCFIIPRMTRYWRVTSTLSLVFVFVLSAILAQSLYRYWLPMAEPILYVLAGLIVVSAWQRKVRTHKYLEASLQSTSLQLADQLAEKGSHLDAMETLKRCTMQEDVYQRLYSLGETLAEQNEFGKAKEAYSSIYRRKRRYKDVPQKLKQLEQQIETQKLVESHSAPALPAAELDKTQALTDAPLASPTLGRYHIKRELGRGANGTVFLGYDPTIDREVAIKTLHYQQHDVSELQPIKERFFKEARAVGRLAHPNIVQVYDMGEDDNLAYMTMDYAKGRPLSDFILPETLLPVVDVYKIILAVAEALHSAHQQEVIHRDIKPSNIIFLDDPFQVRVTDFGIARLVDHSQTSTGEILGSPLYMAPEQLRGEKATNAADIFSLGVTFYQLLTGVLPFNGDNIANLSYSIINAKHPSVRSVRKELPTSATRITNMALQKKPEHRYTQASELAEALRKSLKRDFGVDA